MQSKIVLEKNYEFFNFSLLKKIPNCLPWVFCNVNEENYIKVSLKRKLFGFFSSKSFIYYSNKSNNATILHTQNLHILKLPYLVQEPIIVEKWENVMFIWSLLNDKSIITMIIIICF